MNMDTFSLKHAKVYLGSFSALFSKLGRSLKTANHIVKWAKLLFQFCSLEHVRAIEG